MAESFEGGHYRQAESVGETKEVLDFSIAKPVAYRHGLGRVTTIIVENQAGATAWFDITDGFQTIKNTVLPPKNHAGKELWEFDVGRWGFTFLDNANMMNTTALPAYVKELESKLK